MEVISTEEEAEREFNNYYASFEVRYKTYMDKLREMKQADYKSKM